MPHSGAPLGRVRILLVEDSELDAELLIEQLLEAGLDAEFLRVDGAEDMRAALAGDPFDLVLSDMELPGFSGYQALEILREHCENEGTSYDRLRKTITCMAPTDPAEGGAAFVEQMRAFADIGIEELHVMPPSNDPAAFSRALGEHVVPGLSAL